MTMECRSSQQDGSDMVKWGHTPFRELSVDQEEVSQSRLAKRKEHYKLNRNAVVQNNLIIIIIVFFLLAIWSYHLDIL